MYVIKFSDGTYWIGYNHRDKQLRKAKIYTSKKMAIEAVEYYIKNNNLSGVSYKLVEVEIREVE